MQTLFYVIMVKRKDGKIYPDLHKADGRFYLSKEEADHALLYDTPNWNCFHVVPMVASLYTGEE